MSTHSSLRKRKLSGGKKRAYRSKKKYEAGGYPAETILGEPRRKTTRGMGGNLQNQGPQRQICFSN